MMTAIGAGFAAAGFFHLLTHGVFKALLFLGAGAVIHAVAQQRPAAHGRPRAPHAADGDRLPRRHAVARGHPALRRVPLEGRDPRRRLGRRSGRAVRAADARRVPHGVLHVPRRVPGVLRPRLRGVAARSAARRHAHSHDVGGSHATTRTPARSAGQRWRCRCGSWRCCRGRRDVFHGRRPGAAVRTGGAEFDAPGVADAGRRRRRRRRHPARVADVSAPDDRRRRAGRGVRADPPRGARASSGSTTCSRASTRACCSASRASSAGSTATSSTACSTSSARGR